MAPGPLSETILDADIDRIVASNRELWSPLRGATLFLTGGTGFFGRWLLLSLTRAEALYGLGLRVIVLSRNPSAFARLHPELAAAPCLDFLVGDVRDFAWPDHPADYIIHAAAEASAALNQNAPQTMFDVIVDGVRRVLDYAVQSRTQRMLLVSSGAVYGHQPPNLPLVDETHQGGPDPLAPGNAYGVAKLAAEFLCASTAASSGIAIPVARPFAFLGPFLPLDRHFAAGNFLADALRGGPVRVGGDGSPYRSYMYPTDLVRWLMTILLEGTSARAYNVGSDQAVSIAELAAAVAKAAGGVAVTIAGKPDPSRLPARYVPSIERAGRELSLTLDVGLDQAVSRTLTFYRANIAEDHLPCP